MSGSKIFLLICLSFIGGIFLSSFFDISRTILFGFSLIGISLISIFWGRWKFAVAGFCVLFLVFGIWRHQIVESRAIDSDFKEYNDSGQKVSLIGMVAAEPDIRQTHSKLAIGGIDGFDGKILITVDKYPEYRYGDRLKITGKLETPQEFEDFNYRDYLAKEGIYSVVYHAEVEPTGENQGNFLYAGILSLKERLREVIYQNLPPPQSSILAAMILGDKSRLSQEWKDKLNYAGLRHLTAISGMHVAVLTVILMNLLIALGLWRQQAFYFTIILIALFIVMTGLQPSAVRAGIMGGFFLFAQHLGRLNVSARTVILAASLMLFHNPLLLKLDVGFQLSFLAMLGIIYFLPVFQGWLSKISHLGQLKDIIAVTVAAQIFTLPLLIYNFGYFSLVGIITNILVVPLLPLIMGLGLFFVLSGIINGYLGWFFSLPVWLLLAYLSAVADWFAALPFSAFFFEISWFWLLVLYMILGTAVWRLREKEKLKFLKC
jgi:competence protein ComEC